MKREWLSKLEEIEAAVVKRKRIIIFGLVISVILTIISFVPFTNLIECKWIANEVGRNINIAISAILLLVLCPVFIFMMRFINNDVYKPLKYQMFNYSDILENELQTEYEREEFETALKEILNGYDTICLREDLVFLKLMDHMIITASRQYRLIRLTALPKLFFGDIVRDMYDIDMYRIEDIRKVVTYYDGDLESEICEVEFQDAVGDIIGEFDTGYKTGNDEYDRVLDMIKVKYPGKFEYQKAVY